MDYTVRAAKDPDAGGGFRSRKLTKRRSSRLTVAELARVLGISSTAVHYRVLRGQLSEPGSDGLFDQGVAEREFKRCPRKAAGRKRSTLKTAPGREAAPLVEKRSPARAVEEEAFDPDTRFRLAKARQEEIKLRKMRETTLDLKEAQERAFRIHRMWRDVEDAAVSRKAPLIAARLATALKTDVPEGLIWRELKDFMVGVQADCSKLDVGKALAKGLKDPDEPVEEAEGKEEEEA